MTDQTRWGIPQVQSENKAREYEQKKNKQNKEYTLEELKVSHHNFMIDHKIKVLMNKLKS